MNLHAYQVHQLELQGARTGGFMRAMRKIVDDWDAENLEAAKILPDAWDAKDKTMTVWEVEVGNPLSPEKLDRLVDLAWLLDEQGWGFELIVVDRWGRKTTVDVWGMGLLRRPA